MARLAPSEAGDEGEFVPGPSPGFWGLLSAFGIPWLMEASPSLCLQLCMAFSMRASVAKFTPLIGTLVMLGWGLPSPG